MQSKDLLQTGRCTGSRPCVLPRPLCPSPSLQPPPQIRGRGILATVTDGAVPLPASCASSLPGQGQGQGGSSSRCHTPGAKGLNLAASPERGFEGRRWVGAWRGEPAPGNAKPLSAFASASRGSGPGRRGGAGRPALVTCGLYTPLHPGGPGLPGGASSPHAAQAALPSPPHRDGAKGRGTHRRSCSPGWRSCGTWTAASSPRRAPNRIKGSERPPGDEDGGGKQRAAGWCQAGSGWDR